MKKIVVFTGAGMSKESGIDTFRNSNGNGLWDNYNVNDVATYSGWLKNPELVLDFYNKRRREVLKSKPNKGHILLSKMEKDYNINIITQNVDDLHERAGSTNVLHIHGELMKYRSTHYDNDIYDVDINNPDIKIGSLCKKHNYQLRPHIVWFGEDVPLIYDAIKIVEDADILIVIGTSLKVFPAADLLNHVNENIPIYYIDPNGFMTIPNMSVIRKGASEGIKKLITILKKDII